MRDQGKAVARHVRPLRGPWPISTPPRPELRDRLSVPRA